MYKYPLFFQDSYITTSQSTSCLLKLIREGGSVFKMEKKHIKIEVEGGTYIFKLEQLLIDKGISKK